MMTEPALHVEHPQHRGGADVLARILDAIECEITWAETDANVARTSITAGLRIAQVQATAVGITLGIIPTVTDGDDAIAPLPYGVRPT